MANDSGEYTDGIKDLGKDRQGRRWWHARLYWTDPLTGEPRETKRKYHAPSRGLALQRRDELTAELRTGEPTKVERKRFAEVAAERTKSIAVYGTRVGAECHERKLAAVFGDHWIDAITTQHLQEYLDGLTISSTNNLRNALVQIFALAVEKRYAKINVASAIVRKRAAVVIDPEDAELADPEDVEDVEDVPQALTSEQVGDLLDDLETYAPELYPMIFCQYMLGCRFAEVSALERKRVDLETGIVKILRGQYRGHVGPTKGRRARKAALPVEAREMLREHLARMDREQYPGWEDLVFPRPPWGRGRAHNFWHYRTVNEYLHASFKRTGIVVKGATHVARHTMITVANDVAPSEALIRSVVGHRSKKVHAGYNHPRDARVVHLGETVGTALLSTRKRALQADEEGV